MRRTLTPTGAENEYDVARAEGVIAEDGDPFNAETMNDLEQRIAAGIGEYDPDGLGAANVTVQLYSCVKTGSVYALTGTGTIGRCKIPATWESGDSFTVNGNAVPAYCGADPVDGDSIVAGRWALFVFDGAQLNFNGGGGLTSGKLAQATADENSVIEPFTFYAGGSKRLRTGKVRDHGTWNATINPGGSVTVPEGYHNGNGKVYAGVSWQFVWGFLWHSDRNYYTFGTNSLFGTASGSTWTCKRAGNYRIRAIYSDSIGASGVGVKKNGSWLMNGMFGNKTQDVSLAVGDTIQIVGGAIYGDPYSACVATIVIWAI